MNRLSPLIRRKDPSLWIIVYILAWQPVLYLIPDDVVLATQAFVREVTMIVPSLAVYGANSPEPSRVALFWAIQWCLCPLYVAAALLYYRDLKPARKLPFLSGVFWAFGMFVLAVTGMFLPNKIEFDPRNIRPPHIWDQWMHDMLWPNGLFAVIMPIVASAFFVAMLLFLRATFSPSNSFPKKDQSR